LLSREHHGDEEDQDGSKRGKATYEIDAFYLALAAVLLFLGAGIASVDSVLGIVPLLG
jgi:hypothetical protein